MHELSLMTFFILAFVGLIAGIIDTVGGGGGLITVPALLAVGIPPAMTLGTNKFQGIVGEFTALWRFRSRGRLQISKMLCGLLYTAIGSTLGTWLVQIIDPDVLEKLIPFIMLIVLLYVITSPKVRKQDVKQRLTRNTFYLCLGLAIGFYNGFFGPGTGSFWVAALMFFLGLDIQQASIEMKPLNLIGNVVSLVWFILGGHVVYLVGVVMGFGQVVGAQIGAYFVLSGGAKLIRPVFIIIVSVLTVTLFLQGYKV